MGVKRSSQKAAITRRRAQVANLLTSRISQEEIARTLQVEPATITRDVRVILAGWDQRAHEGADVIRSRELADLEQMERDCAVAFSGDKKDGWVGRRLQIKERRAKLLGLDAPAKQELSGGVTLEITHDLDLSRLTAEELAQLGHLLEAAKPEPREG